MKCDICGSRLNHLITDYPFKIRESTIVILKSVPVQQCSNCSAILIEDSVMARVEEMLEDVSTAAEVEILSYAA